MSAKKLIDTLRMDVKGSPVMGPTYMNLITVFPLQSITSKIQHEMALKVLGKLITYTNEEKSVNDEIRVYLKTLAGLVVDFERDQFKSGKISGTEMVKYLMELQGLTQADLSKELGGQPVVSKILKGERELNLRQVKALAKRFKVSPEVFI